MGFLLSLFNWQYPSTVNWFWLTIVGFTALFAHYCMTKAMQYAEVASVVTLDFFRLPMIAVVGIVFYSENVEIGLLFGALLMLIGNLLNILASKTE